MMTPATVRRWSAIHRWSSLIATAFLFILALTGLPLIFHDEIDAVMAGSRAAGPSGMEQPLDDAIARGRRVHPDKVVQFVVWEPEAPDRLILSMGADATAYPAANVNVTIDRATARPVPEGTGDGFMDWLLRLHADLLVGQAGPPILGLVALAFLLSLVSGIILYAPFMRRLPFGTIRRERERRTRRLDWHNALGITAAAWLLVVGGTGWVNAWGGYIFQIWRASVMAPVPDGVAIPPPLVPPGHALDAAMAAVPGQRPAIIAYPGSLMADPVHYAVYLRGATPLESRLIHAALVDARTGAVSVLPPTPWYITALLLSQPLHFGDYGGLPLKLLWALLDIILITLLWTGLRLWWRGRPA